MKDLKTLIAEYNANHNADVTHVLTGEDFVTLYAVTDAVVFVEVHQKGHEVQSLVISLAVFDKSLSRNNDSDADIKPVQADPETDLNTPIVEHNAKINHEKYIIKVVGECETEFSGSLMEAEDYVILNALNSLADGARAEISNKSGEVRSIIIKDSKEDHWNHNGYRFIGRG